MGVVTATYPFFSNVSVATRTWTNSAECRVDGYTIKSVQVSIGTPVSGIHYRVQGKISGSPRYYNVVTGTITATQYTNLHAVTQGFDLMRVGVKKALTASSVSGFYATGHFGEQL